MSTPNTEKQPATILRPPVKAERPDPTLATHPPVKPKPAVFLDCQIETMPNGEGVTNIVIPADIMKRLKNRSQGVDLNRYVWENVFKPALNSHVY